MGPWPEINHYAKGKLSCQCVGTESRLKMQAVNLHRSINILLPAQRHIQVFCSYRPLKYTRKLPAQGRCYGHSPLAATREELGRNRLQVITDVKQGATLILLHIVDLVDRGLR